MRVRSGRSEGHGNVTFAVLEHDARLARGHPLGGDKADYIGVVAAAFQQLHFFLHHLAHQLPLHKCGDAWVEVPQCIQEQKRSR